MDFSFFRMGYRLEKVRSGEIFMDCAKLTQNVMDVIKEEQVKLGYRKERVRLYYPLESLNLLTGGSYDVSGMHGLLEAFGREAAWGAGLVEVWNEGERFCLSLAPEVAEYVHTHTPDSGFLYDLVEAVSRHGVSMEVVLAVFHRYSEHVRCEKTEAFMSVPKEGGSKPEDRGRHGMAADPGFDCVVWFEDGCPDAYRYCLKEEMGHVTYHRYTEEEYGRLF